MEITTFEVKSEYTETDKSSSTGTPIQEFEDANKACETINKRRVGGPKVTYGKPAKKERLLLIKKVVEEGESIRQAAISIGINYSTAKSICNLYKSKGRLGNDLISREFSDYRSTSQQDVQTVESSPIASFLIETQLPQKKLFKSQEEALIQKKDPFTCLLYQQINNVETKPRGFFSSDLSGKQTSALLSSAFYVYAPQITVYANSMIVPNASRFDGI